MRRITTIVLASICLIGAATYSLAQTPTPTPQPMTKAQIIERVGEIDQQLLSIEKARLIKAYQELEAKEQAAKPKVEEKKVEGKSK